MSRSEDEGSGFGKRVLREIQKILSPEKLYKYRRAEYKFARNFMKGSDDRKDENKKKIKYYHYLCFFFRFSFGV